MFSEAKSCSYSSVNTYHRTCRSTFETKSLYEVKKRPESIIKSEAFDKLYFKIEGGRYGTYGDMLRGLRVIA